MSEPCPTNKTYNTMTNTVRWEGELNRTRAAHDVQIRIMV